MVLGVPEIGDDLRVAVRAVPDGGQRRMRDGDGEERFWMLETIREFAAEQLGLTPSLDAAAALQGPLTRVAQMRSSLEAVAGLLAGGKRLRPAFCYWGFVGAGGDADDPRLKFGR